MSRHWIWIVVIVGLLVMATPAAAGEIREIRLTDGGILYGEVIGVSDGHFSVRTETLGTVRIPESRVSVIRKRGAPAAAPSPTRAAPETPAAPSVLGPQLAGIARMLMGDESVMKAIRALESDPAVRKVLDDPAAMAAVQSGDIATLMANPDFMKLLAHPKIQKIQQEALAK